MSWGGGITYFGETRFRGALTRFGIKDVDRTATLALIGRAGSGRSHVLTHLALQDTLRGIGTVVLDGTGNLTKDLIERLPQESHERLIALDPSDGEHPFSWNTLDEFRLLPREEAVPRFSETLANIYQVENGPLLAFVAEALFARADATLLFLYDVVADQKARERLFSKKTGSLGELESLLAASPGVVSQITDTGRYLAKDTLVRNLLGQTSSKFTLAALAEGGVVVVDFSRIRMFPTRVTPLVRLFVEATRLHGREETPVALYLHDCLRYLSEEELEGLLRDRGIALTVSDTARSEEESPVRGQLLRRAGSVVAFASHEVDAPLLSRVFYPYVMPEELQKLEEGRMLVMLSIDSVRSRPFFASALAPQPRSGVSHQDLLLLSRDHYTISRFTADKLFEREKSDEDEKKPTDSGSFSDAFRSIFTKRAQGAPSASAIAPPPSQGPEVKTPKPSEKKPESGQGRGTPAEVPEEELRKMLYAGRAPA